MIKDKASSIIISVILLLIVAVVFSNYKEEQAIDQSKIPLKVEESKGFQRWITNLKNNDFIIGADEFRLVEENEIYNTKWMTVKSLDQEGVEEEYNSIIESKIEDKEKIVFSPSKRAFVDYKHEYRDGYDPNEAHYYGLREDKVIDARILDCSARANCYFDRAFFLEESNNVFVVSEFSRNIDEKAPEETIETCSINDLCSYTIKVHVIDLLNNSRLVYESDPFDLVFNDIAHEL